MTIREFYQAVIEANINDELTTKATELTTALDARNEKRKGTETKEKKEAAARRSAVLDFLCDNQGKQFTRDQIAEAVGLTPTQVTGACKPIVDGGTIKKNVVLIDKARKVVYSIA